MDSEIPASRSPASPYRYVLFDWDGCLAQSLEVWMEAFKATFEQFGLFPEERAIARQFGDWHGPKGLGVSDADYDRFLDVLLGTVNAELPHVQLYPGAWDLVDALRESGNRVGLITSSHSESLRHTLRNSGLEGHLDVVVTARDVANHKPHPDAIELALTKMGGQPDGAVMVGDSSKDLGAAKNAGIDSILVFPPSHERYYDVSELRQFDPTYVCTSFKEVKNILLP